MCVGFCVQLYKGDVPLSNTLLSLLILDHIFPSVLVIKSPVPPLKVPPPSRPQAIVKILLLAIALHADMYKPVFPFGPVAPPGDQIIPSLLYNGGFVPFPAAFQTLPFHDTASHSICLSNIYALPLLGAPLTKRLPTAFIFRDDPIPSLV